MKAPCSFHSHLLWSHEVWWGILGALGKGHMGWKETPQPTAPATHAQSLPRPQMFMGTHPAPPGPVVGHPSRALRHLPMYRILSTESVMRHVVGWHTSSQGQLLHYRVTTCWCSECSEGDRYVMDNLQVNIISAVNTGHWCIRAHGNLDKGSQAQKWGAGKDFSEKIESKGSYLDFSRQRQRGHIAERRSWGGKAGGSSVVSRWEWEHSLSLPRKDVRVGGCRGVAKAKLSWP